MWKGQTSESFNRLARSSLFVFLAIPVADFKPKTDHVHYNLNAAVQIHHPLEINDQTNRKSSHAIDKRFGAPNMAQWTSPKPNRHMDSARNFPVWFEMWAA
jgi:hypothetical protein